LAQETLFYLEDKNRIVDFILKLNGFGPGKKKVPLKGKKNEKFKGSPNEQHLKSVYGMS